MSKSKQQPPREYPRRIVRGTLAVVRVSATLYLYGITPAGQRVQLAELGAYDEVKDEYPPKRDPGHPSGYKLGHSEADWAEMLELKLVQVESTDYPGGPHRYSGPRSSHRIRKGDVPADAFLPQVDAMLEEMDHLWAAFLALDLNSQTRAACEAHHALQNLRSSLRNHGTGRYVQ